MRIHAIKHVPFEGPGTIAEWAAVRGHVLTEQLALTEEFPSLESVDMLVVMGGPMAADDDRGNPWLVTERAYVAQAAEAGKLVIGVCLGAQIIAAALGGEVRRNPVREIGWFEVRHTDTAGADPVFSAFPEGLVVGHWHGDTFTLPVGVDAALANAATANQAFSAHGGRVVGLQFHLEWTARALADLAEQCADELAEGGEWVQSAESILAQATARLEPCREALFALLDRMTACAADGAAGRPTEPEGGESS